MRLLVVEDETKMAGLLKRGLGEEGYAVDVARTGPMPCGWQPSSTTTRSCWTSCFRTSTGSSSPKPGSASVTERSFSARSS